MDNSARKAHRHKVWHIVAVVVVLVVGYFLFFRVEEAETPTGGGNGDTAVEQPSASSAESLPPAN